MAEWPNQHIDRVHVAAARLDEATASMDTIAALEACRALTDSLTEVAYGLVIYGAGYYTQKRMAEAMGVPASALRGLKEEARARAAS